MGENGFPVRGGDLRRARGSVAVAADEHARDMTDPALQLQAVPELQVNVRFVRLLCQGRPVLRPSAAVSRPASFSILPYWTRMSVRSGAILSATRYPSAAAKKPSTSRDLSALRANRRAAAPNANAPTDRDFRPGF
jgi:hypothetical protein